MDRQADGMGWRRAMSSFSSKERRFVSKKSWKVRKLGWVVFFCKEKLNNMFGDWVRFRFCCCLLVCGFCINDFSLTEAVHFLKDVMRCGVVGHLSFA